MKVEQYLKSKELLGQIERQTGLIELFNAKEPTRIEIKFGTRNDDKIAFAIDALGDDRKLLFDKFLEITKNKIISYRDLKQKEFDEL